MCVTDIKYIIKIRTTKYEITLTQIIQYSVQIY